eukprot:7784659-Karenia_brevis.AAC.1
MSHYLKCIPLWCCIKDRIPSVKLSPYIEEILGLSGCTRVQVLGVLLAYHIYHSLHGETACSGARLEQLSKDCFKLYVLPNLNPPRGPGGRALAAGRSQIVAAV